MAKNQLSEHEEQARLTREVLESTHIPQTPVEGEKKVDEMVETLEKLIAWEKQNLLQKILTLPPTVPEEDSEEKKSHSSSK
jgi:hypothetical protein